MTRKPYSPKSAEGLRKWHASLTPEQRTERSRKAAFARAAKMTPEQRKEHSRIMRAGRVGKHGTRTEQGTQ